ncbi:MAG: FAD-dependent monooxygenase [Bacillaceae bacterium]|nr:FAD-dependent monooxygenase [Bacillaceae bacterium]
MPLAENRVYWYVTICSNPGNQELAGYQTKDIYQVFKHYHEPIPHIIEATRDDHILWNDIYDFKPIDQYAFGRTVLIGDAAHATTPNMGQGACQGIEDAVILASCLSRSEQPEDAFKFFQSLRVKRVKKIIDTSWNLGKIAHIKNPILSRLRNKIFQWAPKKVLQKQLDFLYHVHFD